MTVPSDHEDAPHEADPAVRPAPKQATPPGTFAPPEPRGAGPTEIAAAGLSVLWVALCLGGLALLPALEAEAGIERLRWALAAMVVVFPVAMIWVAALALRASRIMREESRRLQAAIDAIRKSYISQSQRGATEPSLARKLDEIAGATRRAEAALAALSASPEAARAAAAPAVPARAAGGPEAQPSLALGTTLEEIAEPPAAQDFIRALHFPETAEDADGFAALRRAMRDRATAQLVQASQDVLTLMSQDGIYMDDLRPDAARTEVWRAFAAGTRGREVAALGGVRDRSSLALVHGRMKKDPIFRDAGHHFLRVFDRVFASFAERASDAEIQAFSTTRTARAFMLLGRVAGTFD